VGDATFVISLRRNSQCELQSVIPYSEEGHFALFIRVQGLTYPVH